MIKIKVTFLKGRIFSANQGFLKTSDRSERLDKSWPSKTVTFVLIM